MRTWLRRLRSLNRRDLRQLWNFASGDFFAFVLAAAAYESMLPAPRAYLCLPALVLCEYAVIKDLYSWLEWLRLHRALAQNIAKTEILEALEHGRRR